MNPTEPNTAAAAGLQHQNSFPPKVIGKPFKPGQSGNPSGRRRGSVSLTATLKSRLTKADAKAIADKLISQAKAGNRDATRVILERCGDELPLPFPGNTVLPPVIQPTVIFRFPDNGRTKPKQPDTGHAGSGTVQPVKPEPPEAYATAGKPIKTGLA